MFASIFDILIQLNHSKIFPRSTLSIGKKLLNLFLQIFKDCYFIFIFLLFLVFCFISFSSKFVCVLSNYIQVQTTLML